MVNVLPGVALAGALDIRLAVAQAAVMKPIAANIFEIFDKLRMAASEWVTWVGHLAPADLDAGASHH
jgi:hypothetical protein